MLLRPRLPRLLCTLLRTTTTATFTISAITMSAVEPNSKAKSESEWQAILSREQFRILRNKGTELPGTGKYNKSNGEGIYACAGCGTPLYKSTTKFNSGCGWPAFFDAIPGAVTRHEDRSLGVLRTEITCTACGGHLGHVFKGEGFPTPIDERHCVNSISLNFNEEKLPDEPQANIPDPSPGILRRLSEFLPSFRK